MSDLDENRGRRSTASVRTAIAFLLLGAVGARAGTGKEPDRDGDGLSDFAETTKYLTDPDQADSDGDGRKDFIPGERREYTYSVMAVMRVLPPIDESALTDDYQDGRIVARAADGSWVEVEVVIYPKNGVAAAITANPGWREPDASRKRWIDPGPTSNWDAAMQQDMIASLATDGIDLGALTDRQAAPAVARWLLKRAKFEDSFTTFAVEWKNGKASIAKGMEANVMEALRKSGRTLDEQWQRELFGKGMYEHRIHGTCTSTAIYLQTGLRAAGIPTRTVVCVPVLDASDETEHALVEKLEDETVRDVLRRSVKQLGGSWASHTFNEVFVGGRWVRLNSTRLGQNVLDADSLGLMVHVRTFDDHANAGLAAWGRRAVRDDKADVFGHSNPYSCIELSDSLGAHADKKRLAALESGFPSLTVTRAYRYADGESSGIVKMRLDDPDTAGHFVMHVDEGLDGYGAEQYKRFYDLCGKRFVLRAEGRPSVPARTVRGYWVDMEKDVREFYLRVEPADIDRMAKDVDYTLEYDDDGSTCGWRIADGVVIRR